MSLGMVVVVREGIILAADSRSTALDQAKQLRIATDYTDKVFRCGTLGLVTAGWNVFGMKTIAQHMESFCKEHRSDSLEDAAKALGAFFLGLYNDTKAANPETAVGAGMTVIEFLVAGYEKFYGSVYHVMIYEPTDEHPQGVVIRQRIPPQVAGTCWVGSSEHVQRLACGYSTNGLSAEQISTLQGLPIGTGVALAHFTLQDAINYAVFMIEVTMKMQRFSHSVTADAAASANVGGPLDVAKIMPGGFDWIKRKELEVVPQLSDEAVKATSSAFPRRPKKAKRAR